MYLKRLKVNGFKSFASKTTLELEPGVVAIVGPNGSGKSNIADAIRWVLGEQSSRNLRLKKSEEVIFAGTEKRAKGSLAEVSLLLDNSDGAMEIDFSEIELSRVLYRSGESQYLLNGSKVRLNEVHQLLARSSLGTNSYAVIGQGMIDNMVLATPSERKMLFDEATGIRHYEIKREQTARQLEATATNLAHAQAVVAELGPRVKNLAKQAEAARSRQMLITQLEQQRRLYCSVAALKYHAQVTACKKELKTTDQATQALLQKISELEKGQSSIEASQQKAQKQALAWSQQLQELEVTRDEALDRLNTARAELQQLMQAADLKRSMDDALTELKQKMQIQAKKRTSLTTALAEAKVFEQEALSEMERIAKKVGKVQKRLKSLQAEAAETTQSEYLTHGLAILKQVAHNLARDDVNLEEVRLLVHKVGRLLNLATESKADLEQKVQDLQDELIELMREREKAHGPYAKAVMRVRAYELDLSNAVALHEEFEEQIAKLADQQVNDEKNSADNLTEKQREVQVLEKSLAMLTPRISAMREELAGANSPQNTQDIFKLAADLENTRNLLENAKVRKSELTSEAQMWDERLSELRRQTLQWFGKETLKSGEILTSEPLEKLEQTLLVLEARIAEHQENDNEVFKEHKEVSERYEFLTSQINDLQAAKVDLEKISGQLQQLIKTKFETAFNQIAKNFSTYFEDLFGGGRATLSLVKEENGARGIEIKAVPPGKRVESLSTLSGGERALTGIALLAAILKTNPSPFVVLDEIDAALDEANSTRLTGIIKAISRKTQLVLITHNRQTMQAAHTLYGVTMDEHHVSKVLSLKLEQALARAKSLT